MDGNVILEERLFGFPIRCALTVLDHGVHVLLTGGCRSHIGAISCCLPGESPETRVFPGHKDQFVSEPWAQKLSNHFGIPVCVVCGIHYDNISKEQIKEILDCTNGMLARLME